MQIVSKIRVIFVVLIIAIWCNQLYAAGTPSTSSPSSCIKAATDKTIKVTTAEFPANKQVQAIEEIKRKVEEEKLKLCDDPCELVILKWSGYRTTPKASKIRDCKTVVPPVLEAPPPSEHVAAQDQETCASELESHKTEAKKALDELSQDTSCSSTYPEIIYISTCKDRPCTLVDNKKACKNFDLQNPCFVGAIDRCDAKVQCCTKKAILTWGGVYNVQYKCVRNSKSSSAGAASSSISSSVT